MSFTIYYLLQEKFFRKNLPYNLLISFGKILLNKYLSVVPISSHYVYKVVFSFNLIISLLKTTID